MYDLLLKYKGVIRFLVVFLGTYTVLSFAYHFYLDSSKDGKYFPDYVTSVVADQSEKIICKMGYPVDVEPDDTMPALKLIVHQRHVASVVEGCNAISIMILFVSFVLAFYQGAKRTSIFMIIGLIAIYITNVFRIAILTIMYYRFPQFQEILHQLVFPGIIYGMIFLLWMYWVKQFKIVNYE